MIPIIIRPEAIDAAAVDYNNEVARTNAFIRRAYDQLKKQLKAEPKKCDVLDAAQVLAEAERGADQSKQLRSIEYYLKSRALTETGRLEDALSVTGFDFGLLGHAWFRWLCSLNDGVAARMQIFLMGTLANLGYDFVKALAFIADGLNWLIGPATTFWRDKLKSGPTPITPPGGSLDGIGGAYDGMFEDGQQTGMPALREGVDTSTLPKARSRDDILGEMALIDRKESAGAFPGIRSGLVLGASRDIVGDGTMHGRGSGPMGLT